MSTTNYHLGVPTSRDLSGIVQPGRGLGAGLMADRAVMARLQGIAGFPLVPGTLNVRLPGPLERSPDWWYVAAAEVQPDWETRTGQAGYFVAEVLVADRFRGLAFQAEEPGDPATRPTRSSSSARSTCAARSV